MVRSARVIKTVYDVSFLMGLLVDKKAGIWASRLNLVLTWQVKVLERYTYRRMEKKNAVRSTPRTAGCANAIPYHTVRTGTMNARINDMPAI